MIGIAIAAIVVAMLLVRLGWGARRLIAAAGWAVGLASLVALARAEGAWGLAVGVVAGTTTILGLLAVAGWRSPTKTRRPAREAPSIVLPRRWGDLGRRVAVFVLVVPVAFAAAQWLAFGTQAMLRRSGAAPVDAIVLTMFVQPLAWGVVMAVQMTRASPERMLAPPIVAALAGTLLWSAA